MNQKCIPTIEKILSTLNEVCEALDSLKSAVENENEDEMDNTLDMFPSTKAISGALEKLGTLLETRPWEGRKKKA